MVNMLELSKSVKVLKHPNFQKTPNCHKKARCNTKIQMCLKCELSKRPSLLQQHWCILATQACTVCQVQYNSTYSTTVQLGTSEYGTVR